MRRALPWLLHLLSDDALDEAYQVARQFQHRDEDGWYVSSRGEWRRCRLASTDWDDPTMAMSGCSGEFANEFRRKDVADGCPRCCEELAENGSEPDVLGRWGYR